MKGYQRLPGVLYAQGRVAALIPAAAPGAK